MSFPKLSKAFIDGLQKKYNMSYDDVKTYIFCGGCANEKCENTPNEFTAYENYFKLCFPNMPFPELTNECICGQTLAHNCYIRKDVNTPLENILIIGSCCIKKFIESGKSRKCEKCNADHKNRKYNLCNVCKVDKINEEKEAQKEISKYNKLECFDIPYQICQENTDKIYFTKWDKELKIRYCRPNNYNGHVIRFFIKYRIDDMEEFINKRKNKVIEYKQIAYEDREQAKKDGLKYDKIKKLWYKQY